MLSFPIRRRALLGVTLTLTAARLASATPDTLSVPGREDHSPCLAIDPTGSPVLAWIAMAPDTTTGGRFDELAVAVRDGEGWGEPQIVAGPGDYFTPDLTFASDGARWIVWAEHDGSDSRVVCRRDLAGWSQVFTLGDPSRPDLEPSICADDSGGVVVVWQGWRDDYEILFSAGDSTGFSPEILVSDCGNSDREPDVVWGDDRGWIVWSSYQNMPYNLILRTWDGASLSPALQITNSYRARNLHPSIAWDEASELLWIAGIWINRSWQGFNLHEVGELNDPGSPRVRAFDGVRLWEPAGLDSDHRYPLHTMQELGYETYLYGSDPMPDRWGTGVAVVPVDGRRVWFFHKQSGPLTELGSVNRYWSVVGTSYGGGTWSSASEFLDLRSSLGWEAPVAATSGDSLWVAWSADERDPPIHDVSLNLFGHDLNVVVASAAIDTTDAGPPGLVSLGFPQPASPCSVVARPVFTIDDGAVTRTLLYGDNHRHSWDLSWDAWVDPNLQATIFFSLDFLGHDFLVPSDHAERYSKAVWAWVAKWSKIYDVPERFRIFPGYERAMRGRAGGDQNTIFRDPDDFAEATAAYPTRESWHEMYDAMNGIDVLSVPHTTAQCGAETDWDHLAQGDPSELPAPLRLVEVYQSARESFEYLGCPKQFTGCVAPADTGWVNVALAMGMRLGLIAASDHTIRAGFLSVLAEDRSRDAIWKALWDRHTFGSSRTTKFRCDFRVNGALMGSEIQSATSPTLSVLVEGPNPLTTIEIHKDGDPSWYATSSADSTAQFEYVDPDPVVLGTSSYYYLRVFDADARMLWTSPVWVDFHDPTGVDSPVSTSPSLTLEGRPNPARGAVDFVVGGLGMSGGRLRIHDVAGRLVRRFDFAPGSAGRELRWDRRDHRGSVVASGIYFAVLQSRGESRTVRVVLIH